MAVIWRIHRNLPKAIIVPNKNILHQKGEWEVRLIVSQDFTIFDLDLWLQSYSSNLNSIFIYTQQAIVVLNMNTLHQKMK